jgi:hypothetical protein
MTTLLEDLRLALRQICRTIGLEGTGATVVPLIVLGLALNLAALSATEFMRHGGKAAHQQSALRNATRTELKAMRIVLHSTIKKINNSRQRWCVTRQWVKEKQKNLNGSQIEVGVIWGPPTPNEGCDIKFLGSATRKRMVAVVQC